jgi:hypothetical protein
MSGIPSSECRSKSSPESSLHKGSPFLLQCLSEPDFEAFGLVAPNHWIVSKRDSIKSNLNSLKNAIKLGFIVAEKNGF